MSLLVQTVEGLTLPKYTKIQSGKWKVTGELEVTYKGKNKKYE